MWYKQALLFTAGVLGSLLVAWIATKLSRARVGVGWVYYSTISLRMLLLLAGCTALYLAASPGASPLIGAYALGIVAAWIGQLAIALVELRK